MYYNGLSDACGAGWCLTVLWRGLWHFYKYGMTKLEDEQITPIVIAGTLIMLGVKGLELIFDI